MSGFCTSQTSTLSYSLQPACHCDACWVLINFAAAVDKSEPILIIISHIIQTQQKHKIIKTWASLSRFIEASNEISITTVKNISYADYCWNCNPARLYYMDVNECGCFENTRRYFKIRTSFKITASLSYRVCVLVVGGSYVDKEFLWQRLICNGSVFREAAAVQINGYQGRLLLFIERTAAEPVPMFRCSGLSEVPVQQTGIMLWRPDWHQLSLCLR